MRLLQADRQTDKRTHTIWTHGLTHGQSHGLMDIELRFRKFTFNVDLSIYVGPTMWNCQFTFIVEMDISNDSSVGI